ncbi:sensor histidine kinase, partial [Phytoactinopolyspora endophytica]|uniref:sensor histidine kinase n=1 Tax=Phytoactinopolyspora endophytica TaxID=1642495 RepID=UPI00197BF92F
MEHAETSRPSWQLTTGQLIAIDVVAAAIYTAVVLTAVFAAPSSLNVPAWAGAAIVVAVGLPVAVRRIWPRPVLGLVASTSLIGVVAGVVADPFLAAAAALYPVALTEPRRPRVPTQTIGVLSVVTVVGSAVGGSDGWQSTDAGVTALGVAILGGVWTLGRVIRERRDHAAYTAQQLAQQAVTDERLRIARELHDIVAHSMSVVTVKAGIANHVIGERPEEAADALRVIESTGRSALTEMRRLLGVLRSESDDGTEITDAAGLGPNPSLADLVSVADHARTSGVDVDLRLDVPDGLPEGVELSAYRIVQEAMTNVIKHAAPARCRVSVRADGTAVTVEVSDDGPGRRELSVPLG